MSAVAIFLVDFSSLLFKAKNFYHRRIKKEENIIK